MHDLFVLDKGTGAVLKDRVLLIDTNFIVDAWIFKKEAAELLAEFSKLGCYLLTTRSVATEFLGGTTDEESLREKQKFLEIIFTKTGSKIFIPHISDFPKNDSFLEFSRQVNKFGCTDFEIYLALKKYAGNLLFMTRNHKDFTAPTFERLGFITLLGKKEIHTHGIYSYAK